LGGHNALLSPAVQFSRGTCPPRPPRDLRHCKRRYINTLLFLFHLSLSASVWVLGHASHQIVVAIISSTGLSPTYQSARSFNVKCDTTSLHTFTCGVPRGSVHGILLFVEYTTSSVLYYSHLLPFP